MDHSRGSAELATASDFLMSAEAQEPGMISSTGPAVGRVSGCGKTSPEQAQQGPYTEGVYSITSSARARSGGGTVIPSAFAVLRLTTNSKRDDCTMGRSAGFSPVSMRPT